MYYIYPPFYLSKNLPQRQDDIRYELIPTNAMVDLQQYE